MPTLVAASRALLFVGLVLPYEAARDVARLGGHARNVALLALLVALSIRLLALQPHGVMQLGAGAGMCDLHGLGGRPWGEAA